MNAELEQRPRPHVREPNGDEERWILSVLGVPNLFIGHTTRDIRLARLRDHITERGVADKRAGYRDGEPETWASLVGRLYGEPVFHSNVQQPTTNGGT